MSRRRARKNVDPVTVAAVASFVVPIVVAHGSKKVNQYKDGDLNEKVRMLRNWCWWLATTTGPWACVYLAKRERAEKVARAVDRTLKDRKKMAQLQEAGELAVVAGQTYAASKGGKGTRRPKQITMKKNVRWRDERGGMGPGSYDADKAARALFGEARNIGAERGQMEAYLIAFRQEREQPRVKKKRRQSTMYQVLQDIEGKQAEFDKLVGRLQGVVEDRYSDLDQAALVSKHAVGSLYATYVRAMEAEIHKLTPKKKRRKNPRHGHGPPGAEQAVLEAVLLDSLLGAGEFPLHDLKYMGYWGGASPSEPRFGATSPSHIFQVTGDRDSQRYLIGVDRHEKVKVLKRFEAYPKRIGDISEGVPTVYFTGEWVDPAKKNPHRIQDPNTSGQGFHPDHAEHPYHDTLVKHGLRYTHTTPVRVGGELLPHHTYRLNRRFGVGVYNTWDGWRWSGFADGAWANIRASSDRRYLDKYLKRAVPRHREPPSPLDRLGTVAEAKDNRKRKRGHRSYIVTVTGVDGEYRYRVEAANAREAKEHFLSSDREEGPPYRVKWGDHVVVRRSG